jgi:protocatechuate 3,4-dioxygenase beta subunit
LEDAKAGSRTDSWYWDDRSSADPALAGGKSRPVVWTRRVGTLTLAAGGRYAFRTIMPGLYPGRTRHYHVKVQAPNRPVLTTQFYFPDEKANLADEFFHSELVMEVAAADDALRARFDVVLAMR